MQKPKGRPQGNMLCHIGKDPKEAAVAHAWDPRAWCPSNSPNSNSPSEVPGKMLWYLGKSTDEDMCFSSKRTGRGCCDWYPDKGLKDNATTSGESSRAVLLFILDFTWSWVRVFTIIAHKSLTRLNLLTSSHGQRMVFWANWFLSLWWLEGLSLWTVCC